MMRRFLVLIFLCAAAMWAQPIPIDCGQSLTLAYTPTTNRYNLVFSGSAGETVLFRLVPVSGDPAFQLELPTIADTFGNPIRPRPKLELRMKTLPMKGRSRH